MAHVTREKTKLLNRIRRIKGQLEGVERLLEGDHECVEVLQIIASCRGAMNGLMAELLEGHIKFHVLDEHTSKTERAEAADELMDVVRTYMK